MIEENYYVIFTVIYYVFNIMSYITVCPMYPYVRSAY